MTTATVAVRKRAPIDLTLRGAWRYWNRNATVFRRTWLFGLMAWFAERDISRVDLRANRTFNWQHRRLTLFAEVINLLDRDNVRFNPPGVNTATHKLSNLFESMIPIVPSAGVLIEF